MLQQAFRHPGTVKFVGSVVLLGSSIYLYLMAFKLLKLAQRIPNIKIPLGLWVQLLVLTAVAILIWTPAGQ